MIRSSGSVTGEVSLVACASLCDAHIFSIGLVYTGRGGYESKGRSEGRRGPRSVERERNHLIDPIAIRECHGPDKGARHRATVERKL